MMKSRKVLKITEKIGALKWPDRPAWRLLLGIALAFAATGALLGAATFLLGRGETLFAVGAAVARLKPYFVTLHWVLIGMLWWEWETVIDFLQARGKLHPGMREMALAARHRTVLMLLAVEVFIVMRLPLAWIGG